MTPGELSQGCSKNNPDQLMGRLQRSLLQAQLPTFDDSVVKHLWADCRKRVPDVTSDEVGCLFAAK
jgi:hypothetical protein